MSLLIAAVGLLGVGQASQPAQPQPLLDAALQCRALTDDAERLRCFDAALGQLAQAAAGGSLVLAERRLVEPPPRLVEGLVRSAREFGYQRWLITLDKGGTWQTIENSDGEPLPRPGQKVRIERTALGGYILEVDGGRNIRARPAAN